MIDQLRAIYIFSKAAELGSFRAAAKALNLSPSVVSYHIGRLEKEKDIALFYRSTRHLVLTESGKRLFKEVQLLIRSVETELDYLSGDVEQPSGELRIAAPAGFARSFITRQISKFSKQYPNIRLSISYSDQQIDILNDAFDLAIRGGVLKDSGLMSKKMFQLERKLVAAPRFLEDNQVLNRPKDLENTSWIWHSETPNFRMFVNRKTGRSTKVKIHPAMVVDNGLAMGNLCAEGLGLATGPTYLLEEYLKSGKVIEVLPEWKLSDFEIYAVWPANSPRTSITNRFVEYLSKAKVD